MDREAIQKKKGPEMWLARLLRSAVIGVLILIMLVIWASGCQDFMN
jgi:hypothetical protein